MSFVKALALALSGLALNSAAPPPPVDSVAILLIQCGGSRGTAWSIAPGRFITAHHVTSRGECSIDGQPAPVVREDPELDIAEVRGPDTGAYFTIRCRSFRRGEDYRASGYAYGEGPITSAYLTAIGYRVPRAPGAGTAILRGQTYPGMSGGPVMDRAGRVLGIVNVGTLPGNPAPWMGSRQLKDTFACR